MRNGPRTTGDLAKAMPGLTRFAVMQHLSVLEAARLVIVKREGRNRFNHSNPALLKDLFDQWLSPLSSRAAETAQHLRRYAETQNEAIQSMNQDSHRQVRIELETRIKAPSDLVFRAMTEGFPNWWPHRMKPGATLFFEPELGGRFGENWPDGGGVIYGVITLLDPGKKYVATNIGMFGDYTATNTESVEPDGAETIMRKSVHMWGDVSPEIETMIRDGGRQLIEDALRMYCEAQVGSQS